MCAGSNVAVDNMVEKLIALGLRVVRIGQPAKVTEFSLPFAFVISLSISSLCLSISLSISIPISVFFLSI